MRFNRIYTNQTMKLSDELILDQAASHHLVSVLRLKKGDRIFVFNDESEYQAECVEAHKRKTIVRLLSQITRKTEPSLSTQLALGISRGDRMDYALQKSVELGVNEITPIISNRCSVRLVTDRIENKMQHWQAIVVRACEQAGRMKVPTLNVPTKLSSWLPQAIGDLQCILHTEATDSMVSVLRNKAIAKQVTLLVGPEGGFADEEVALAKVNGFQPVLCGPRILRTETAPVVALSLIQTFLGDFV